MKNLRPMVTHPPLFGTTQVKIEFLERDLHPLDKLPLRHTDTIPIYLTAIQ
ncbi:MAG: hypothetical protein HOF76_04325 [Candidatus Scalindua sp.]|nr:hypothetical protein [Candidatus Scalindua sp.]